MSGMRGTWRPKRVGIVGKPHGGQGRVEVGIELDYGEDVFEADDMERRVCPCFKLKLPDGDGCWIGVRRPATEVGVTRQKVGVCFVLSVLPLALC